MGTLQHNYNHALCVFCKELKVSMNDMLFYILSTGIIFFALGVLLNPNPITAALSLVMTMVGLAGVFFQLGAHFIAGVQLIVYAGAVMVLFVMVLMLFDLKTEENAFTRGSISGGIKILVAGWLTFLVATSVNYSMEMLVGIGPNAKVTTADMSTKTLSEILFKDYIVAFEVLGIVLLVVAVGAVSLSRIKGGTHAES